MAEKDVNGSYWLYFEDSYICSECNKQINDQDKIFVDGIGNFHKSKRMIEVKDVRIYHHKCLIINMDRE
ncbi:MAG: hypothetical protein ACTSRG_02235 [Candidatus Helarchaeota archaeon]